MINPFVRGIWGLKICTWILHGNRWSILQRDLMTKTLNSHLLVEQNSKTPMGLGIICLCINSAEGLINTKCLNDQDFYGDS